jgi:hypothetical protein
MNQSKFQAMILAGKKISDICHSTFMQACHLCESMECGDNTNPLVTKIKQLQKEMEERRIQNNVDLHEIEIQHPEINQLPQKDISFREELEFVINRHSMENGSNTPDFILAEYLQHCLAAFDLAVKRRDKWYGKVQCPGQSDHVLTFPKGADNGTLGPED